MFELKNKLKIIRFKLTLVIALPFKQCDVTLPKGYDQLARSDSTAQYTVMNYYGLLYCQIAIIYDLNLFICIFRYNNRAFPLAFNGPHGEDWTR